jgi:heptosyltransferase-1
VQVLIVKTSSMGDVVHALPALSDMLHHVPGLQVDWLVEAPFAAIPALHPGVRRVLPLAWRKWRKRLADGATWRTMGEFRRQLRRERYDLVLDLQGLAKSVMWGLQARGPMAGYDRSSIRDPLASMFYGRKASVSWELQAVDRCRRLAAFHLGYALPATAPDFGILPPEAGWQAPEPCGVLIPCASRPEKLWPQERWIAVGRHLVSRGLRPVLLWGNESEQRLAQAIAQGCDGVVPPFLSVKDTAAVLGRAVCVVGLDTGFTHLGAAFGRPTVGIYCDHDPGLVGITGSGPVASVGGKGQVPELDAVIALVQGQAAAWQVPPAHPLQSSSMRTGG